MPNRSRIWLIALIVVVLGGLAWLALSSGPPDPVYAGRNLSSWLTIYYPDNQYRPEKKQTDEAVRKLGTNAVPLLLSWLRASDPPWKANFFALLGKQHVIKIKHTPPLYPNYAAAAAFHALGASASNAVPALIDIYGRNISFGSQFYTAFSLGEIGPPAKAAVPVLMDGLTNSDPLLRVGSMQALSEIHSEPEKVVPLLIQALTNSISSNREYAAAALGEFGTNAKPAVPALLKLLRAGDNPLVLEQATAALKKIDPAAAASAGIK